MDQPSKGELDRIGERIRQHGRISDDDLAVLRVWLRRHEAVNLVVVDIIEQLGYQPAQRVKTLTSIEENVPPSAPLRRGVRALG